MQKYTEKIDLDADILKVFIDIHFPFCTKYNFYVFLVCRSIIILSRVCFVLICRYVYVIYFLFSVLTELILCVFLKFSCICKSIFSSLCLEVHRIYLVNAFIKILYVKLSLRHLVQH